MGRSTRTRTFLFALVGVLAAVAFAVVPAAAGDLNLDGTGTPDHYSTDTISSGGAQLDGAAAGFENRVRHYFADEAGKVSDNHYTSLAFQGERAPWVPLVTLNPVQGLAVGLGTGRSHALVGYGNAALNPYGLGLGAAYRGDLFSLYLMGLRNVGSLDSTTRGSGDFARYQISAGGTVQGLPVGIGLDVFYFDRARQQGGGDAGFGAGPNVPGDMTLSVEEILFSGFLDGESAVYRRSPGNTKLSAANPTPGSQGKSPANIRAIGGHLQFRPLMETALQFGGAYLQFVEEASSYRGDISDESLGTSMYLRLTHGITDSLQLKAAFDYLFPSEGTRQATGHEDTYKVAAGLFWSW